MKRNTDIAVRDIFLGSGLVIVSIMMLRLDIVSNSPLIPDWVYSFLAYVFIAFILMGASLVAMALTGFGDDQKGD